ncbi:MAG: hypothetical protein Q9162_001324 [Coniocarpon cinnabarinum]
MSRRSSSSSTGLPLPRILRVQKIARELSVSHADSSTSDASDNDSDALTINSQSASLSLHHDDQAALETLSAAIDHLLVTTKCALAHKNFDAKYWNRYEFQTERQFCNIANKLTANEKAWYKKDNRYARGAVDHIGHFLSSVSVSEEEDDDGQAVPGQVLWELTCQLRVRMREFEWYIGGALESVWTEMDHRARELSAIVDLV